jgi:hypothetical protein
MDESLLPAIDVRRQKEVHRVERAVPEPSSIEGEITIENLEKI